MLPISLWGLISLLVHCRCLPSTFLLANELIGDWGVGYGPYFMAICASSNCSGILIQEMLSSEYRTYERSLSEAGSFLLVLEPKSAIIINNSRTFLAYLLGIYLSKPKIIKLMEQVLLRAKAMGYRAR